MAKYVKAECRTCFWVAGTRHTSIDIDQSTDEQIIAAYNKMHWRDTKPHTIEVYIGHKYETTTDTTEVPE